MSGDYLAYSHGLARLLLAAPNTTLTSKRTLNQILEGEETKFLLAFGDTLTLTPVRGRGWGAGDIYDNFEDHLEQAERFAQSLGVPADAIQALRAFTLGDV